MNARPRHIGYLLKRFPRISETFVASELIELERQGERVTVFAIGRPSEPFVHAFVERLRAPVVYLPHRPIREPLRVANGVARSVMRDPIGFMRAARVGLWPPRLAGLRHLVQATVLREEAERAGIDHIHAHFATTAARVANLCWRMGGPSYSVTAHAKDIYHREVRINRLREKLANATFVATVSSANRDYLRSLVAGQSDVHVVHNGADLSRLGGPEGRRPEEGLVVSVARLVEKKGLTDLVQACGLLARRGITVRLEIVGDGPSRDELEALAARLEAPVTLRGALPHEQAVDLCRRAAVFCLPCVVAASGDRDGLPTSVLEAMALGVPVVTTAVNGLRELVVHERTGLVVPERDPEALARAIERLLADPSLGARLALEGRRHVEEHYSLQRSVSILRELLPEAV